MGSWLNSRANKEPSTSQTAGTLGTSYDSKQVEKLSKPPIGVVKRGQRSSTSYSPSSPNSPVTWSRKSRASPGRLVRGSVSSLECIPIDMKLTSKTKSRERKSIASLSIGSPDPETFSFSQWHDINLGDAYVKTYRQSMGSYSPMDNSITLSYGVIFCKSWPQYHLNRDKFVPSPYKIHLEEYSEKWMHDAAHIRTLLERTDRLKLWEKIEHIGSTSIPGMVAKPVIDIMITLKSGVRFKAAIDNFLREQVKIKELPVRIGFTDKAPFSTDDWGFFQIPRQAAQKFGMCEVNIHVFAKNSQNAIEKSLFRDFLSSQKGAALRKEYCEVKRRLMLEVKNGLQVSQYAIRKNSVVARILVEGTSWSLKTAEGKKAALASCRVPRGSRKKFSTLSPEFKEVKSRLEPNKRNKSNTCI